MRNSDSTTTAGAGATSASLDVESYRTISLYAPNRAPAEVDLSDNTNSWGAPTGRGADHRERCIFRRHAIPGAVRR